MTERLTMRERAALLRDAAPNSLAPEANGDVLMLAGLLAAPAMWVDVDPGLEDTVLHAVAAADPARPAVVTRLRPRATRRRRVRRWSIGSAAAVVAAVTVVAGLALTRNEVSPDFRSELTATAPAPAAGTGFVDEAEAGADAGAEIEMYRSDAGFRITLDAHGLPRLPTGEYYEAWLRSDAGRIVAIGTFSSSAGHITLWSGVSAKDFPVVSVTVEPVDDDPAPSGRRVLTGRLHAT